MDATRPHYRLSELSALISEVFRMHFSAERFWVTAEITGLKISRGHCYLQLAEKDERGSTPKAEFRGIIWSSLFDRLQQRFRRDTGSPLKEQMQVLLLVEIQYHERYGLSLLVQDIDSTYTLGQLELERRKTVEQLRQEGIYDRNRDIPLPVSMQRIAVVSAEDSKGYEDFLHRLSTNVEGFTFFTRLYPALLQGDLAAGDMVNRLNAIRQDQIFCKYDAVVIVRGGGAASSLECFNNYHLAAAIARFPLPVITGIGHHTNLSVADEVAHTHRMTPTDVANFLIEHQAELEGTLGAYEEHIRDFALQVLGEESGFVQDAGHRLLGAVQLSPAKAGRRLDQSAFSLRHRVQGSLLEEKHRLQQQQTELIRESRLFPQLERASIDELHAGLKQALNSRMAGEEDFLQQEEKKIRLLDPAEVLRRGYSYTVSRGKIVHGPEEVQEGDTLHTFLEKGVIVSTVITPKNG